MLLLTNANHVELETTLEQLALNLRCDAVEPDMASGKDCVGWLGRRGGSHCELMQTTGLEVEGKGAVQQTLSTRDLWLRGRDAASATGVGGEFPKFGEPLIIFPIRDGSANPNRLSFND